MWNRKLAGIYKITHKSGLFYLGCSVNCLSRWQRHYNDLSIGKHHSKRMQELYDIDGVVGFKFEVIEYISLTNFKAVMKLKGAKLTNSFRRYLEIKEKEWMGKYNRSECLNTNNRSFKDEKE